MPKESIEPFEIKAFAIIPYIMGISEKKRIIGNLYKPEHKEHKNIARNLNSCAQTIGSPPVRLAGCTHLVG